MNYKHPKEYKGIRKTGSMQDIMRVYVEENCLKCSEFCGQEHDFDNCRPLSNHCPQPIHYPPMVGAKDFVKMEVEE